MPASVTSLGNRAREITQETSSTLKAFAVLEALVQAGRPVTLAELISVTELPKPSLHRTLALFEEAGLLTREPGGRAYAIGKRLSRFGLDVLRNEAAAAERRTVLRRLVEELHESCNLAVLRKGDLIYLDRVEADWPLRLHVPVGGAVLRPHGCASGKLLLAFRPPAERARLLAVMPLERFTERTITQRSVLASELDRIASAGYAVDNEEYVVGVACVAVPVRDGSGEVVAAVAVQAATARLPLMQAIAFVPRLQAAAAEIGATLG
ncbi:MAG: IclR family transcriptional regulator [Gammaproteobacteria bacterium]|nr:IclR family transcriptional regulator [Gammaproteobacteria bacterium]